MKNTFVFRTALIVGLVALSVVAPGALAGKGGNGKGNGGASSVEANTVEVAMVVDQNGDRNADWGDIVTFDVFAPEMERPWVLLNCYQDGA